uniref:Uncharacterized protein n=1 Tax=Meloidogyne enterolobii TaxID=390850 RepID=A0A6V7U397_MELEN|nr:unnamed protein product [Meloidogyne enterolobii]
MSYKFRVNRGEKIIKDESQNTIVFQVGSNVKSDDIEIPDDCILSKPFKFYITPRVILPNKHAYCQGDGPNGEENDFNKWVCLYG